MLKENYFDLVAVTETEPVSEPTPDVQPEGVQTETQTEVTETPATPQEYDIDGEKYTLDQIKEWKQGSLRQSDYTKKTQALAREKEQYKEALEVFNYLKDNPHLLSKLTDEEVQAIKDKVVENPMKDYEIRIRSIEIDRELEKITSKDTSVNEVELLNIATEKNMAIQDAYEIYRGRHVEDYLKKQSAQLTEKIKQNATVTRSIISSKPDTTVSNYGLSPQEMDMASKLGMEYSEYAKWKA